MTIDQIFHASEDIVKGIGLVGLLGLAWKAASEFTELRTTVNLLVTNHLPHLQAAIDGLSEKLFSHLDRDID